VCGVSDEDDVRAGDAQALEHGLEPFWAAEVFGEHRHDRRPPKPLELHDAVAPDLVGAHRPRHRERVEHLVDARKRLRDRRVVPIEVVVDRQPEAGALVRDDMSERHLFRRYAERDVRRGEGLVGVEQGAVEVEDDGGDRRQRTRFTSTDELVPRPLYSPLLASSSHRAPHDWHSQLSIAALAR
jgi:hypothetical protein